MKTKTLPKNESGTKNHKIKYGIGDRSRRSGGVLVSHFVPVLITHTHTHSLSHTQTHILVCSSHTARTGLYFIWIEQQKREEERKRKKAKRNKIGRARVSERVSEQANQTNKSDIKC